MFCESDTAEILRSDLFLSLTGERTAVQSFCSAPQQARSFYKSFTPAP